MYQKLHLNYIEYLLQRSHYMQNMPLNMSENTSNYWKRQELNWREVMKVHIPFYFSLLLLKSFAWLNIIIKCMMIAIRVQERRTVVPGMITSSPLLQTGIIILKGIKSNQTKWQQQKQTTTKNTNTQNQQRGIESGLWGILFPSFCNVSRCCAIFPTRMDLNMCLCCQAESGHPPLSNQALEVARSFNKLLISQGLSPSKHPPENLTKVSGQLHRKQMLNIARDTVK